MNTQPAAVHSRSSANGFGNRKGERQVGSKIGGHGSPWHDQLIYITSRLIGHHVDVHVKNGSIYSGILHTANEEKEFEIILKKAISKSPYSKTMITIPAKEVVQVIAKDVQVLDEVDHQSEKQQEVMRDSLISQSCHVEIERCLEPWVPDEEDPQCPELENIFDGHWNRGWDQFTANETLFGVKSTIDEEFHTTKLERVPKMRELKKEAQREIEDEEETYI